jgi:cell division protein FtsQ
MATQRKHQPCSRRSGRLFHLYIALSMLLIVAAVSAGSMVFFKVHQFEVTGNGRYSDDALLEASGIQDGDNLVRIPRHEIERRLEESLPYLKKVRIRALPPDRVVIEVTETEPAGAVTLDGAVWYIDSNGKLLEKTDSNEGYPAVTGLRMIEPEVGKLFQVEEEEALKAKGLRGILSALETKGLLDRVQAVELSSSSSLSIRYEDRLTVKMGLNDDFLYDLKMLEAAEQGYIAENWSQGDTGTLDMTKREGEAVLSID